MTLKQNNLIGLILIIVGGLALLGNFGILGGMSELFFSVAVGAAGVYLIRYHLTNRTRFWASIVGFSLLGLGFAAISGAWAGFYFLGLIGGGFATTYLAQRKHWWAVIPAGVLWTLAGMVAADNLFPRWDAGALLFAGFAATFGYLFAYEHKRWAIFPAVALLVVGVLNLSFTGGWVFPALLIAAGVYAMNRQTKEKTVIPSTLTAPVVMSPAASEVAVDKPVDSVRAEEAINSESLARKLEVEPESTTSSNVASSETSSDEPTNN